MAEAGMEAEAAGMVDGMAAEAAGMAAGDGIAESRRGPGLRAKTALQA